MSSGAFGTNWLDLSNTSNCYNRTYVQGFVDISGGNLILRNNNMYMTGGDLSLNGKLIVGSDVSLNKRLFVGGDASFNGNTTFLGAMSTKYNSTNLLFGYNSKNTTTGEGLNTGFGNYTFQSITTGTHNTAFGYKALSSTTTSNSNTAVGVIALQSNNTGVGNSAIGRRSLTSNSTGSSNVAIGNNAGDNNTTGDNNTYLGANANANANSYSSSTALGASATITKSNQIMMGTASEVITIPNQIEFSYTSVPTFGTTSLGYIVTTSMGTSIPSGNYGFTMTNPPTGIYIITAQIGVTTNQNSNTYLSLNVGGVNVSYSMVHIWSNNEYKFFPPMCYIGSVNGSQSIALTVNNGVAAMFDTAATYFRAIRIA